MDVNITLFIFWLNADINGISHILDTALENLGRTCGANHTEAETQNGLSQETATQDPGKHSPSPHMCLIRTFLLADS